MEYTRNFNTYCPRLPSYYKNDPSFNQSVLEGVCKQIQENFSRACYVSDYSKANKIWNSDENNDFLDPNEPLQYACIMGNKLLI